VVALAVSALCAGAATGSAISGASLQPPGGRTDPFCTGAISKHRHSDRLLDFAATCSGTDSSAFVFSLQPATKDSVLKKLRPRWLFVPAGVPAVSGAGATPGASCISRASQVITCAVPTAGPVDVKGRVKVRSGQQCLWHIDFSRGDSTPTPPGGAAPATYGMSHLLFRGKPLGC
jgi:hypothetical protein